MSFLWNFHHQNHVNLLTTVHEDSAQFTLCSAAKSYLSKIVSFQKKKKGEGKIQVQIRVWAVS